MVPTILDYFNIEKYKMLTGKSLLPLCGDTSKKINDEIFMKFGRYEVDHDGFGGFQPLRSIYDGRYKLTINLLTSDELYDLENDKGEMVNLINNENTAAIRDNLHDRLLNWMNELGIHLEGTIGKEGLGEKMLENQVGAILVTQDNVKKIMMKRDN